MNNEPSQQTTAHNIPGVAIELLLSLDTETAAFLVMRAMGVEMDEATEIVKTLQREGGEGK